MCLVSVSGDPVQVGPCETDARAEWFFNFTNNTIAISKPSLPESARGIGACLDLNGGAGPDIDMYNCHDASNHDFIYQKWSFDLIDSTISPVFDDEVRKDLGCLSIENISPWNRNGVR